MNEKSRKDIVEFCETVKNDFGKIADADVKREFKIMFDRDPNVMEHSSILAILEENSLLDKDESVNTEKFFYRNMFKKLNESLSKNMISNFERKRNKK